MCQGEGAASTQVIDCCHCLKWFTQGPIYTVLSALGLAEFNFDIHFSMQCLAPPSFPKRDS